MVWSCFDPTNTPAVVLSGMKVWGNMGLCRYQGRGPGGGGGTPFGTLLSVWVLRPCPGVVSWVAFVWPMTLGDVLDQLWVDVIKQGSGKNHFFLTFLWPTHMLTHSQTNIHRHTLIHPCTNNSSFWRSYKCRLLFHQCNQSTCQRHIIRISSLHPFWREKLLWDMSAKNPQHGVTEMPRQITSEKQN